MEKVHQNNILWGLCAIGLFGLCVVGIYSSKSEGVRPMVLTALFEDVSGLKVGSKVMMAGLPVGEVTAISLNKDLSVSVAFEVDGNLEIPDDSDLRMYTGGFFSEPQLSLSLGGGFDLLTDGDTIAFTQSSVDFLRLFKQIVDAASVPSEPEKEE